MRLFYLTILTIIFGFRASLAFGFDLRNYDVYYLDVDGNGTIDVYFHGREHVVLIHGDVSVPLLITAPSFAAIVPYCDFWNPGPDCSYGILGNWQISDTGELPASMLTGKPKLVAGKDFYYGDFNGDGSRDVWVLGPQPNWGLVLSHGAARDQAKVIASLVGFTGGVDGFDPRTSQVAIYDANGDGRDDIVFRTPGSNNADIAYVFRGTDPMVLAREVIYEPAALPATLVGSTDGNFRVSESGAATYSIELFTPPGTAGVTPEISLNYSSQGRSGLLGQGWSLSAMSAITRCRQTLTQDSSPRPLDWTDQDRFCLDGQRLMVVSGTYGSGGSVYRIELDSSAKITAYGGTAGNPERFLLEKKDGSKTWYGHGANSKELAHNGKTYGWARSEFRDSVGNAIIYTYAQDAQNGFRLQEIRYGFGHTKDNYQAGKARVVFSYENRSDPIRGYVSGYATGILKRLSRITVYNDDDPVRDYHLRYLRHETDIANFDRSSRLAHVQECAGNECLAPTKFYWSISGQPVFRADKGKFTLPHGWDKTYHGAWQTADIDGDGHLDIVIERIHESKFDKRTHYFIEQRLSSQAGTSLGDSSDPLQFG